MRHSAWEFADQANQLWDQGKRWQANFCTDMLNLAEFKGLVRPEIAQLPTILYFHENQFAYPNQQQDQRDLHFGISNFSAALAADAVWYNSEYNRDSMQGQLAQWCSKWPDYAPTKQLEQLRCQCEVVAPCIEFPPLDKATQSPQDTLHLIWAARWEHDKGPAELLQLLKAAQRSQLNFVVSIIGQTFRRTPPEFQQIRDSFSDQIVRWGYQPSRAEYWNALAAADVFVSTAHHEFFGLAAAEAIATGLYPLLPNRLAYPGLLSHVPESRQSWFLYDGPGEAVKILQRVKERWTEFQDLDSASLFRSAFGEKAQARRLDTRIADLISDRSQ